MMQEQVYHAPIHGVA